MNPTILTIRSIGSEFAKRVYAPIVVTASIVSIVLTVVIIWLATYSQLWLLLLIPLLIVISITAGVLVVIGLTIRTVTPTRTSAQKHETALFVDKLQRLSETAQTPKVVLLFRVVRDIAAPRADGFIGSLATDTTSLRRDFVSLQKSFN